MDAYKNVVRGGGLKLKGGKKKKNKKRGLDAAALVELGVPHIDEEHHSGLRQWIPGLMVE